MDKTSESNTRTEFCCECCRSPLPYSVFTRVFAVKVPYCDENRSAVRRSLADPTHATTSSSPRRTRSHLAISMSNHLAMPRRPNDVMKADDVRKQE